MADAILAVFAILGALVVSIIMGPPLRRPHKHGRH